MNEIITTRTNRLGMDEIISTGTNRSGMDEIISNRRQNITTQVHINSIYV